MLSGLPRPGSPNTRGTIDAAGSAAELGNRPARGGRAKAHSARASVSASVMRTVFHLEFATCAPVGAKAGKMALIRTAG